jgi:formate hydrogenlyase transcriptional activator
VCAGAVVVFGKGVTLSSRDSLFDRCEWPLRSLDARLSPRHGTLRGREGRVFDSYKKDACSTLTRCPTAQRIGQFELANCGTIFLDEIGEAPLELQPKLLRVLQEREFERLGSSRTIHTDARLVTATNVDLPGMVDEKKFRADLYYRLNVFPIRVPALRERPEDVPLLVRYFARSCAARMGGKIKWIPSTAMDALVRYSWPGNIRELQNLIERAVIRSTSERLDVPVSEIDEGIGKKARGSQGTLKETREEARH